VKAEDLDNRLKQIQASLAQYKAVEDRGAQLGDFVIADYVCMVDGKEIEKRENDWFELKEDEFMKGMSKQLVGVRPTEEKEIQVTFPEDLSRKELAGKQASFRVKVREIKSKTLPALNDDLAKEAGEYQSFEDLKKKIKDELFAVQDHEKEVQFEKALLDELIKHNGFEVPERLLQRRVEEMERQTREDFKRHGSTEEEFDKQKDKIMPEIEKEARRQVQIAFLLDEIAQREKLTVGEEDLKKRYEILAQRAKRSAEEVEKFYQENERYRESLLDQIQSEKAIDYIKNNAKRK